MDSDDNKMKRPTEGEGKALIRERQKVKQIEKTTDERACEFERLRNENAKQKSRIDELKQKLAAFPQGPNGEIVQKLVETGI